MYILRAFRTVARVSRGTRLQACSALLLWISVFTKQTLKLCTTGGYPGQEIFNHDGDRGRQVRVDSGLGKSAVATLGRARSLLRRLRRMTRGRDSAAADHHERGISPGAERWHGASEQPSSATAAALHSSPSRLGHHDCTPGPNSDRTTRTRDVTYVTT